MDLDKIEELAHAASPGPWTPEPPVGDNWPQGGERYHWSVRCPSMPPMISHQLCRLSSINKNEQQDAEFISAANPAAVLEMIDLIRKQESCIDELTVVTGDQHMRLDAVLLVQAGLITTLQEIRAQFDEGGPMQKFIDAKLTATGVTL